MNLIDLSPLLTKTAWFSGLADKLGEESCTLPIPEGAKPFALAALSNYTKRPLLIVCPSPADAKYLYEQILVWRNDPATTFYVPEVSTLPFERLVPDQATIHQRVQALAALVAAGNRSKNPPILVASVPALTQMTLNPKVFARSCEIIRIGSRISLPSQVQRWNSLGYLNAHMVTAPGTIGHRGGIIDLWPPTESLPFRIELFGELVESIRRFDPITQRSVESTKSVRVAPAAEILPKLIDANQVAVLWDKLGFSNGAANLKEHVSNELSGLIAGELEDASFFYTGFFCSALLLNYLPTNAIIAMDHPSEIVARGRELDYHSESLKQVQEMRGDVPTGFPSAHASWEETSALIKQWNPLVLPPGITHSASQTTDSTFDHIPTYSSYTEGWVNDLPKMLGASARIVLASVHASRLSEVLTKQGYQICSLEKLSHPPSPGSICLVRHGISEGFRLTLRDGDLVVLTDTELFGAGRRLPPTQRRSPIPQDMYPAEIELGGYVVHIEHGIAKFNGTLTLNSDDGEKEYLSLEYAAGDRLYVPTDQIDRVSPYFAPGDKAPTLTRLGTQEWTRSKERAKDATRQMAQELLELYAARHDASGLAFASDTPWQRELEDSFPYIETRDQLNAVNEVKRDMESPLPMDRLVCGDVGYGKTEVALRAAFKAVMEGYQVAVLVPTTILAEQHRATFAARLEAYPVHVEVLSRFQSRKEQTATASALAHGTVDIIIGTHRLLQKDISFKNLGLVIIDEEHRFGVTHKERLKQMRRDVDFLALSATPIPRTLHLSLAGIRDLSTMETPPEERLPIKTYIAEDSDETVREAMFRELDRGGQIFFVHNRISTIHAVADRLREIAPEATVGVGHGQMEEGELENIMNSFMSGQVNVLVCTTIIEAGLDIPNANTLIVDRADRLGLAQLYQLRGRIGRRHQRAYAYFLIPHGQKITATAQKRLKTILTATELGAGFHIAMRDLEIRGAGNILGAEQSGHIHAVGFALYTRLLAETVAEMRTREDKQNTNATESNIDVKIDLPLQSYIPETYVANLATRLTIYQRCLQISSEEQIVDLKEELQDRFGALPKQTMSLLDVIQLRLACIEASVASIEARRDVVVMRLSNWEGVGRVVIGHAVGPLAQVGSTQVRLLWANMGDSWLSVLLETLRRLTSLRNELLARVGLSAIGGNHPLQPNSDPGHF